MHQGYLAAENGSRNYKDVNNSWKLSTVMDTIVYYSQVYTNAPIIAKKKPNVFIERI